MITSGYISESESKLSGERECVGYRQIKMRGLGMFVRGILRLAGGPPVLL